MPRSFLIKKLDFPSEDNGTEDPDINSENKESDPVDNSKQDKYRGPLSPNSEMAFIRQAAFENNNFLPFLAHAATAMFTMPHSWKVKKELYNEFFVLDDPKIWQVYAERQQSMYFQAKLQQQQQQQQKQHESVQQEIIVDTDSNSDKVPSSKPGELSPKSNDENEKVYQCKYCNKSFTRSWNFQRHVLIHTGRKPHKCDKCPKAFVLAAHLKIHNRIHTGEKPYKCNICGRGFAQLTNLQRHVLTHTGEKPHKCDYCAKGFVSSSDLRRHVRIHTGEKPYKCKVCSKAFTTSGNLQSHILTHTGEKPYQCDVCNWKFISSSNLRTHIRTHHFQNGDDKKESDEGES